MQPRAHHLKGALELTTDNRQLGNYSSVRISTQV